MGGDRAGREHSVAVTEPLRPDPNPSPEQNPETSRTESAPAKGRLYQAGRQPDGQTGGRTGSWTRLDRTGANRAPGCRLRSSGGVSSEQ